MYIVITGTSRGIGLELTRLALEEGHNVLAIARKPEESQELMNLKHNFKTLEVLALDLLKSDSQDIIASKVSSWPQVDVVINNAGVLLGDETMKDFELSFLTNSIKPLFITKSLIPKLKKSSRPLSLQISSLMGSIEDNTSGGNYSYRASKTALNMLFKCLSADESWLTSVLVHPGWVKTRMGGQGAPTSVAESAGGIWKIVQEAKPAHNGKFITYKQETLPW